MFSKTIKNMACFFFLVVKTDVESTNMVALGFDGLSWCRWQLQH